VAKIVLLTGGGRSGKSSYAERLAERRPGTRIYLATALPLDEEMKARIAAHRASRARAGWMTWEEPLFLARAIRDCPSPGTVVVDCLTMWVNNLLWQAQRGGPAATGSPTLPTEDDIRAACTEIVEACRCREGLVILVTNEVGLGIIPGDPLTRLYRDLLGRCNQVMAAAADAVVFMISGLPLVLKDEGDLVGSPGTVLDPSE